MSRVFSKYNYPIKEKLDNFEKYVRRQSLARFLVRYELFKKVLPVKGSIVECGVHNGGGLLAWAKLSASLEPYAIHRKIIGFDTFEGFVEIDERDKGVYSNENLKEGGLSLKYDVFAELQECIKEFDENRFLNQFEKVEMIRGDALNTIPAYIEKNKHLIIALLFLDFDLYEPTKAALQHLLKRVPKGGVVVFDEINNQFWPGETIALLEEFHTLNDIQIQKFDFDPNISYIVL